jgi:hypothetical protein
MVTRAWVLYPHDTRDCCYPFILEGRSATERKYVEDCCLNPQGSCMCGRLLLLANSVIAPSGNASFFILLLVYILSPKTLLSETPKLLRNDVSQKPH